MERYTYVIIRHYPKTTKGHSNGYIRFADNSIESLIGPRVTIELDTNVLRFHKSIDGHGIKLANSKIQLWSMSWITKLWEGYYPLEYDDISGCYYISKCNRQEVKSNKGALLGRHINYVSHNGISNVRHKINMNQDLIIDAMNRIIDLSNKEEITTIAETIKLLITDRED